MSQAVTPVVEADIPPTHETFVTWHKLFVAPESSSIYEEIPAEDVEVVAADPWTRCHLCRRVRKLKCIDTCKPILQVNAKFFLAISLFSTPKARSGIF